MSHNVILSLPSILFSSPNSKYTVYFLLLGSEVNQEHDVASADSIKSEQNPVFCSYDARARELNQLFDEVVSLNNDDASDDDECVMMDEGEPFPLPLSSTPEGLIKREGDTISGNKAFIVTVSIF